MKTLSQTELKKLVKEKNLEVTRDKTAKPKKKELEKKADASPDIMAKSATIVAESAIKIAEIGKAMQIVSQKYPKKRKWKFTPVRDVNNYIRHITVEEL